MEDIGNYVRGQSKITLGGRGQSQGVVWEELKVTRKTEDNELCWESVSL